MPRAQGCAGAADTLQVDVCLKLALAFMPFQCELNQPVDEFGVGNPACLPKLGIHADFGEAGDRIEFVYKDLAVFGNKEVNPRHALAA